MRRLTPRAAPLVKHTKGKFTAMCYEDKSEWTMGASEKRTDLFPEGNWSDAPNRFYQAKPESEDEDADLRIDFIHLVSFEKFKPFHPI